MTEEAASHISESTMTPLAELPLRHPFLFREIMRQPGVNVPFLTALLPISIRTVEEFEQCTTDWRDLTEKMKDSDSMDEKRKYRFCNLTLTHGIPLRIIDTDGVISGVEIHSVSARMAKVWLWGASDTLPHLLMDPMKEMLYRTLKREVPKAWYLGVVHDVDPGDEGLAEYGPVPLPSSRFGLNAQGRIESIPDGGCAWLLNTHFAALDDRRHVNVPPDIQEFLLCIRTNGREPAQPASPLVQEVQRAADSIRHDTGEIADRYRAFCTALSIVLKNSVKGQAPDDFANDLLSIVPCRREATGSLMAGYGLSREDAENIVNRFWEE